MNRFRDEWREAWPIIAAVLAVAAFIGAIKMLRYGDDFPGGPVLGFFVFVLGIAAIIIAVFLAFFFKKKHKK
jgi:hypothetical protein